VYFDYKSWWVYPIMPLYLGVRETVGLTNRIVTTGARNDSNDHALFVADLFTIVPGAQTAAGQSLAQSFRAVESGGLTPGLLGGLYVDYAEYSVACFTALGLMLAWTLRQVYAKPHLLPVYVVLMSQIAHLFHRGFLKPEYLTAMCISAVYLRVARRGARASM
jgi:hypothetical protein